MNTTVLVVALIVVALAWWAGRKATAAEKRLALDTEAAKTARAIADRECATARILVQNLREHPDLSLVSREDMLEELRRRLARNAAVVVLRFRVPPGGTMVLHDELHSASIPDVAWACHIASNRLFDEAQKRLNGGEGESA